MLIVVAVISSLFNRLFGSIVNIKGTEMLSKETRDYLTLYPISTEVNSLAQKAFYEAIEVNQSIDVNIIFPVANGDISAGPAELFGLLESGNEKTADDYYSIQYNSNDESIGNKTKANKTERTINCTYTSSNAEMIIIGEKELLRHYEKIKQYSIYSFGLFRNTLHDVKTNTILKAIDEYHNTVELGDIIDYWIIKQPTTNSNYLAILKHLNLEKSIVFYKTDEVNVLSFIFFEELKTKDSFDLENINVNALGVYQRSFVIGTSQGIFFIQVNKDDEVFVENQFLDIIISSLIVINDTVYAIGLKQGLYIFDMNNVSNSLMLPHQNMLELDYVINPFTGLIFIGVYLDSLLNDDFFIELLLEKPFVLTTSKVFSLKESLFSRYSTPDSFYTYFYDELSRKVYRIRRGMLNQIKTTISSISIELTNIQYMIPYYNYARKFNYPALVTNKQIVSFDYNNNITLLKCRFNSFGNFTLVFDQLTDSCAANIGRGISVCHKIHYKLINVAGYKIETSILIHSIVIPITLILFMTFLILFWKKMNCLINNKLKLVDPDKKNRETLYQCQLDTNNQLATKDTSTQNITSSNRVTSHKENHYPGHKEKKTTMECELKLNDPKNTTSSRNDHLLVITELIPKLNKELDHQE